MQQKKGIFMADLAFVAQVVRVWANVSEREGWGKLPVYGLGGSSGGALVLYLPQRLQLQVGPGSSPRRATLKHSPR